jgi:cysteinyl-tRNA synthetase
MVNFIGDKMSKSVGNILDAKEAVELHGRNAVRMWFLQSHYSQPIDYSEDILYGKRRSYEKLMFMYQQISSSESSSALSDSMATELRTRFDAAMQDDLNTPKAIAAVFDTARRAVREISTRPEAARKFDSLEEALEETLTVLGFDLVEERVEEVDGIPIHLGSLVSSDIASENPDRWVRASMPSQEILDKVANREKARREKDWVIADQLRDELHADGWTVEDTPEGPILTRS